MEGYKPIETKQNGIVTEFVGMRKLQDIDTGEVIELQYLNKKVKHSLKGGWRRVYLEQFMELLTDLVSGRKIEIVNFIIDNLNSDNQFVMTQIEVIKRLGVSSVTITATYKYLTEMNFWKKTGLCFTVNPKFICAFGSDNKNAKILINYEAEK